METQRTNPHVMVNFDYQLVFGISQEIQFWAGLVREVGQTAALPEPTRLSRSTLLSWLPDQHRGTVGGVLLCGDLKCTFLLSCQSSNHRGEKNNTASKRKWGRTEVRDQAAQASDSHCTRSQLLHMSAASWLPTSSSQGPVSSNSEAAQPHPSFKLGPSSGWEARSVTSHGWHSAPHRIDSSL